MKKYSYRIIIAGIKDDILAICNYLGKDAEYFQHLRQLVTKYDQRFQVFAAWLLARNVDPESYIDAIDRYSKKITQFSVGSRAIKINNEVFEDAEKLEKYIRKEFPVFQLSKSSDDNSVSQDVNVSSGEETPVIVNQDNSIRIYEIKNSNDAIELVGNDTKWCIGEKGPNNMWQSYRDGAASTFFVIEDDNPPTLDQRKVAVDFAQNDRVFLTDIPNKTGDKLSNGWTWDDYKKYLTVKGVNLDAKRKNPETGEEELILKNKPLTEEEKTQAESFRAILYTDSQALTIPDVLLWQSGKSRIMVADDSFRFDPNTGERIREDKFETINNPDAKFYLSRYLGLGKRITPEVLSYLLDKVGGEDLITKYVNTGFTIPDEEYEIIRSNKQLLTSYLRKQIIACIESSEIKNLPDKYFEDLISLRRKDLIINYLKNVIIIRGPYQNKFIVENPEFIKMQIELKISKCHPITELEQTFLAINQEKELIMKYVSNCRSSNYINSNQLIDFIIQDSEIVSLMPKDHFLQTKINSTPKDLTLENENTDQALASISNLVRIAQKLDNKNYYKLADKFTNTMKRYSYRIIIAGLKEDIEAQCKYLGITDPEYIKLVRQKVDDYKGYQVFAAWLYLRKIEPESIVASLDKYVKSRQLDPSKIKVSKDKKSITIDDKVFEEPLDPVEFTEYIHATYPIMQVEKTNHNVEVKSEDPVITNENNSIKIYEVDSADDGRRLVGDDTNWCIGYKGPSNMWQGYRDTKDSSFFIVFDQNPPTPNQRKVAIDFTKYGVELTDIPNRTGTHLSNDMDWDQYSRYLRNRGINLDATRINPKTGQEEKILQNKPVTPEERIQKATFSTAERASRMLEKDTVLLWQSGKCEIYTGFLRRDFLEQEVFPKDPKQTYLQYPDDRTSFLITIDNPEAIYYTARWMSQGKPFTDEILSLLMKSVGGTDVIVKFLNSGSALTDSQYGIIRENRSLWKTYIRTQIIRAETGYFTLSQEYFQDLMNSGDDKLITSYLSLGVNTNREFDVILLRDKHPEYLNLLLHSSMNKTTSFSSFVQKIIIDSGDQELIEKFVRVATNILPEIVSQIHSDPELFLIFSKAKLALPSKNAFFSRLGRQMVEAVLRSGDKEAIKKAALGRGFEYDDFKIAREMGVENEAKLSILKENNIDPNIYYLYDPYNPYDVSLVDQIQNIDTLKGLYPTWKGNPKVAMAYSISNFENRPLSEKTPLPESDYELMLYLINDKDYMKFISVYDLTNEQKDNLKSLYSELQNSLKDPEFVETFFKNFPLIKGTDPETPRMFSDIYNNVSQVLHLLPSESLEIPEVKKYVEENIENIKIESLLKHIDVPWLYEAFVERCAYDSEFLRTTFDDFYRYDQEFALHFLGDCFEKQKPHWEYFTTLPVNTKIKIATVYFEIYPDDKESRKTLSNFFFDSLLLGEKSNRSTITQQLYILRNFPKLFYYKIANGDIKTRYIYPEIRSALRQMYPDIANLILQAEEETKYGSDYFDENTEEVIQGKRPIQVEPEIQEDPFSDMPSEEDWPKQASYKLMVKIAQRCDHKKKYKIADILTNILRKYHV